MPTSGGGPLRRGGLLLRLMAARFRRRPGLAGRRPPAILWAPACLVALVLVLPPAYLALRALGSGAETWELIFRWRVLQMLARTLLLAGSVSAGAIALAVPLAWLTLRTDLPGRRVWAVLTVLPLVIPSYVAALVVVVALGPRGMLQGALEGFFGIQRLPDIHGFPGALLTLTFLTYPYVLLTVRGALARLDPSLEEVSRGAGYGPWATFRRVVLPLLRPSIAAGGLLVALYTLNDFGAVSLLRYETFTWAIYLQYESALDRTLGAGLSLVLMALALALVAGEALTRGRSRYYRAGAGAARAAARAPLGRWRWPALAFCAGVVLVALALPVGVLAYWVWQSGIGLDSPLPLWSAARNSVYVSAIAAAAAVMVALPVAALTVRYPGRLSAVLERVTYLGFALPGITIALALVFFGANYTPFLYQSLGLLVVAYLVLFLPAAVGAARASLLQVGPNVEQAARSLGRSPLGVFTSVTMPLVRPGLVSGAALVFLLTMKELPATLILSPIGFRTLATGIWGAASEAFFARAAAAALLLVLVSAVPMALLVARDRASETRM